MLAPTGTIGFMMDCDTTGIEPDIALVKYKKLVGGGVLKIVNNTVPLALQRLGYTGEEIGAILQFIDEEETIEGAPALKPEHLSVFDCAFKPRNGTRSIHYMGHIRMMARRPAVPLRRHLQDRQHAHRRPPSRTSSRPTSRPGSSASRRSPSTATAASAPSRSTPARRRPPSGPPAEAGPLARPRRLPDERHAITHKFSIGGHEGYITVGMYDDGMPGELFVVMAKEGSVVSGLMDTFATAISMALQYGVPLQVLSDKFSHTRFEPSGFTGNPEIPIAKSITDYIFRWLALKFLPSESGAAIAPPSALGPRAAPALPARARLVDEAPAAPVRATGAEATHTRETDAPPCPNCGEITVRNGACYKCNNCGTTTGCS